MEPTEGRIEKKNMHQDVDRFRALLLHLPRTQGLSVHRMHDNARREVDKM